jgi:hypothetical protein
VYNVNWIIKACEEVRRHKDVIPHIKVLFQHGNKANATRGTVSEIISELGTLYAYTLSAILTVSEAIKQRGQKVPELLRYAYCFLTCREESKETIGHCEI